MCQLAPTEPRVPRPGRLCGPDLSTQVAKGQQRQGQCCHAQDVQEAASYVPPSAPLLPQSHWDQALAGRDWHPLKNAEESSPPCSQPFEKMAVAGVSEVSAAEFRPFLRQAQGFQN